MAGHFLLFYPVFRERKDSLGKALNRKEWEMGNYGGFIWK